MRQLLLIILSLVLMGCQKPRTYEYFMLHPDEIKSELASCQHKTTTPPDPVCIAATQAQLDVNQMLNQASSNGQAFGSSLINDQIALSKTEQDFAYAEANFKAAKKSYGETSSQAKLAHAQLVIAERQYQAAKFKVDSKLAVLSLIGM